MIDTLYVSTKRCAPEVIHDEICQLGGSAFGLIMTPRACGLCAWHDGAFDGNPPLTEAFEIRAFCRTWEMRWVRDGHDGVATLMSECKDALPCAWNDPTEIQLAGALVRGYLLWGTVDRCMKKTRWTILRNGRTAPLQVPLSTAGSTGRIQLVAREYLAQFAHGNVCVFDQRLVEIVAADESFPQAFEEGDE